MFTNSKLAGCRIPFPDFIINDTFVDAWYNLFKINKYKVFGKVHLIIGCVTACPNFLNYFALNGVYSNCNNIIVNKHWTNLPFICSANQVSHNNPNTHQKSINTLKEMFPALSLEVIKDVYEMKGRKFQDTLEACLELDKMKVNENVETNNKSTVPIDNK